MLPVRASTAVAAFVVEGDLGCRHSRSGIGNSNKGRSGVVTCGSAYRAGEARGGGGDVVWF